MAITTARFGHHESKPVEQFRLTSATGAEVDIISYGVAVRDWRVPSPEGWRSVVLGFDQFDAYPLHSPHFGCLAGRVANRISGASFELDGQTYRLPANLGPNHLHGGPNGLGRQVWQGEADSSGNSVQFTYFSPDGEMGYPGNVEFTATYTLAGNRLRLDLVALPDRRTPISLVQHQYFNLGTTDDVLDHHYQIAGHAYTQLSENLIPTGAILPVEGTKWDFRQPRNMRDQAANPIAYDGNLVLATGRDLAKPACIVRAPDGELTLKLWTDRPGVQLYNAVTTDVPVPGLNGRTYRQYSGFCLEDQSFPDALHNPHFPSIIHSPDNPYSHLCEIEIA